MINGITDVIATVSVPKSEYEELVRDSEQLAIVKNVIANSKYVSTDDLKIILDIERGDDETIKSFEEMLRGKEGDK